MRRRLGVSPREFEIALLLMDGFSTKRIAIELGLSMHTVNSHLRRLFSRLGVSNRASVVSSLFLAYLSDD